MKRSLVLQLAIVFALLSVSTAIGDSKVGSLSSLNSFSLTKRSTLLEPWANSRPNRGRSDLLSAMQVMAFRWHGTTKTLESMATAACCWNDAVTDIQKANMAFIHSFGASCERVVGELSENRQMPVFLAAFLGEKTPEVGKATPRKSLKSETSTDQATKNFLPAIAPSTQYWSYYADCDRWGVELTLASAPETDQTRLNQLAKASPDAKPDVKRREFGTAESGQENLKGLAHWARLAADWLMSAQQRRVVVSQTNF